MLVAASQTVQRFPPGVSLLRVAGAEVKALSGYGLFARARAPPSEPSERLPLEQFLCRQHRAGAQTARRAKTSSSACRYRWRGSPAADPLASLSVLWRPHGHHRDLQPRLVAAASANGKCHQERHLMSPVAVSHIRHRAFTCRSSTGHAGAQPNRTPALISTPHASRLSLIKQSRAGSASRRNQLTAHSNSPGGHFIANKSP